MTYLSEKRAKELWDSTYSKLKPDEKLETGVDAYYTFKELPVESNDRRTLILKSKTFLVDKKDGVVCGWSNSSKRQRILVIGALLTATS